MKCDICERGLMPNEISWEYGDRRYCRECRDRESKKSRPITDEFAVQCIRTVLENRKGEIRCGFGGSQIPEAEVVRMARDQLVETLGQMIEERNPRDRLGEDY